jgi:hypothetical protein
LQELVALLKARWSLAGIPTPPGVSEERIRRFERREDVLLPDDMRLYFSLIDGMGRCDAWDDHLIGLYDLDSVGPCILPTEPEATVDQYRLVEFYIFGSHTFGLPNYCINLWSGPDRGTVIAWYNQERPTCIRLCSSFHGFLKLYVSSPEELY